MAIPNNVVALPRIDSNYLTADDYLMAREILNEVVDGYNETNFLSFLELTGRTEVSKNTIFSHYEKGKIYRSVGIATVKPGATAATATITLTADSYSTVGSLSGNIARSPLKATDVVMLPGGIHAYVTAKTSPTPTSGSSMIGVFTDPATPSGVATEYTLVRRDNSTEDLGAALTAMVASSQRMIAYTNAHAEGSYQPIEGMDALDTRYSGQMQIVKSITTITGDADSNDIAIDWPGGGKKYTSKLRAEQLIKHKADMGWKNMLSPGGSFTNAKGEKVLLSKGMEGYIRDLGNNYAVTGTFDLADLDAVVAIIKANRGGKEYVWATGATLRSQIETILRSFTSNGGITYNTFGIGADKNRAVDLGFGSFHYSGITFHLLEEELFSHPEVTGLLGMNYDKTGFLIPMEDQKVTYMDENLMQKVSRIPSIRLRYKTQSTGESRRFKEMSSDWKTNGGKDEYSYNLLSQEGLQMAMLHKFIRVYPA